MKKTMIFGMILFAASLMTFSAEAAEKLYICRPCSREFIPQAQEVITSLGLETEVCITPSSCLGPCDGKYVIKFRDVVYSYMNADTLRQMLISFYNLEENTVE
ncbi:MAG TPA: hypothetical protein PK364_01950 [Synergistaceae bacterium]|nr:hypothetical protein [Synergistaceae bacterium]HPJ26359.1 hypothetical protein [Synergistaceae bacterium]HPQ36644.1 hypothetical protein [Synergistaceae bacterium]